LFFTKLPHSLQTIRIDNPELRTVNFESPNHSQTSKEFFVDSFWIARDPPAIQELIWPSRRANACEHEDRTDPLLGD
jgi:hypothetical protein